ncbi:MAG: GNAT family N-acetyltransferase [Candidatus Thorarchaeota archaeon]
MFEELRDLKLTDHRAVNDLCMGIWGGRDYVPDAFPTWIENDLHHPIGIFSGDVLQAIGNLEIKSGKQVGWVKGLRVREAARRKGLASKLVNQMIMRAKQIGLETLRYATSSRNIASMKVAENLGFALMNDVRYFRLEPPFPPHPSTSPSIMPLQIGHKRLHEILETTDLIQSETFPIRWEFHNKDINSLEAILDQEIVQVIFGGTRTADSLVFFYTFERDGQKTTAFTMYSTNRSLFVDAFSRALDYLDATKTERAVFFLGPRVEQWIEYTIRIPQDFSGRRFLLYEKKL